jgi:hypothetical protein
MCHKHAACHDLGWWPKKYILISIYINLCVFYTVCIFFFKCCKSLLVENTCKSFCFMNLKKINFCLKIHNSDSQIESMTCNILFWHTSLKCVSDSSRQCWYKVLLYIHHCLQVLKNIYYISILLSFLSESPYIMYILYKIDTLIVLNHITAYHYSH